MLAPLAFVVAWEAGLAVFGSVTGGVSVLAASVALYSLAAGHGGAYVSLALPATASRQILVLAAFALFFTYAESGAMGRSRLRFRRRSERSSWSTRPTRSSR